MLLSEWELFPDPHIPFAQGQKGFFFMPYWTVLDWLTSSFLWWRQGPRQLIRCYRGNSTWEQRLRWWVKARRHPDRRTAATLKLQQMWALWVELWWRVWGSACSEWAWSELSEPLDLWVSDAVRNKADVIWNCKVYTFWSKCRVFVYLLLFLGVRQRVPEQWRVSVRRVCQDVQLLLEHGLLSGVGVWIGKRCADRSDRDCSVWTGICVH